MLINRNIQMLGTIVLIVAATLVTISAVRPAPVDLSWSSRPDFSFLVKSNTAAAVSNEAGLAQYHLSERGASATVQDGLAVYQQSERVLAYAAANKVEGLGIYHTSERGIALGNTNGLAIYHQSERMQPVNWTKSSDPLYKYHQSEWFGR